MVERRIKIIVNGKEREASERYIVQKAYREEPFFTEQRPSSPPKLKQRYQRKFKQMWISALIALGIGAAFGLIMLSLFTGEHSIIEQAQGKGTDNDVEASEAMDVNLSVSIIQGGAFQTLE